MGWCMEALRSGPRQAWHESGHHQEVSIWLQLVQQMEFRALYGTRSSTASAAQGFWVFRLFAFLCFCRRL